MALGAGALAAVALTLGALVTIPAGVPAGLAATAATALGLALWVLAQPRRVVRLTRAERSAHPRLVNLAEGLARQTGEPVPELWVVPSGRPNLFVSRWRRQGHLGLTAELLESFTRTELEAVVAHGLGRLRRSLLAESFAASVGGHIPGAPPLVGVADDLWAVSATRYPPALASALEKAGPPGPLAAFWLANDGPTHEPSTRRRALLEEL